jgi:hypothetical protein
LQCYFKELFIFGKILSGQFREFVDISFARSQECGNSGSAFIGHNITVSAADFGD